MFGCKRLLLRERISEHLRVCSASVVHCGMQWNRQLLNKAAKKRFKKIVKGFEPMINCDFSDQDLDIISALQDQNEIRRAYRTKRSVRQLQRNYFTPVNPLLPLRIFDETEEFLEVDSSDDELRKNELELKKKKSPFDGCYLCKLEPGFQHLHVLGCMSTQNVDETP
uniref:TRAF-type domain-containing protein n=1 Tax=Acrobeloides nanus TaxID=290746 RepID=A0A914D5B5_9BILA